VTSPYVVQTWVDGAGGGTPVNAARLTHIEAGLSGHDTRLAALEYDTGWVNITFRGRVRVHGHRGHRADPPPRETGQAARRAAPPASPPSTPPTPWPTCPRPSPPPAASMGIGGGSSAGNAVFALLIGNDRTINIRTGDALGTYYRFDAANWWID
jgi:hypothetical protein